VFFYSVIVCQWLVTGRWFSIVIKFVSDL
jgi:hypothetical protein